ncbi:MAG: SEL1-like repeat protein, partial [Proteobacteria bacterium]|nr:SEL1-like repeat protein [Pseudomonadota bacterium]
NAQFNLGAAYINGDGIAPDYVIAHRWMVAAKAQREDLSVAEQAEKILPQLEQRMSPEQLVQARRAIPNQGSQN